MSVQYTTRVVLEVCATELRWTGTYCGVAMTILTTKSSLFAYVGHQALGYHTAGNAQLKVVAEEQAICVRSS